MTDPIIAIEKVGSPIARSGLSKKALCDYVVNIATGCGHACSHCLVPGMPVIRTRADHLREYGVQDPNLQWGQYVIYRPETAQQIREMLPRKRTWEETESGRGVVMLCIDTDPYQSQTAARITAETLEVLLQHKKRIRLLTRGTLWLKQLDLIRSDYITIGSSIPYLVEDWHQRLEGVSPSPMAKITALLKAKQMGIRRFVAIAPTIPPQTYEDLERVLQKVVDVDPEVIFWEHINPHSNLNRMKEHGITWTDQLRDKRKWAESSFRHWRWLEELTSIYGVRDRFHPWPAPGLVNYAEENGFTEGEIEQWFYRPTVEMWPDMHVEPKQQTLF